MLQASRDALYRCCPCQASSCDAISWRVWHHYALSVSRLRHCSKAIQSACAVLHVPVLRRLAPYDGMRVVKCLVCGNQFVAEVLVSSLERPRNLSTSGPGELIEARAARRLERSVSLSLCVFPRCSRSAAAPAVVVVCAFVMVFTVATACSSGGEASCVAVSEELIFLEHSMYQQLLLKLKVCHCRRASCCVAAAVTVGSCRECRCRVATASSASAPSCISTTVCLWARCAVLRTPPMRCRCPSYPFLAGPQRREVCAAAAVAVVSMGCPSCGRACDCPSLTGVLRVRGAVPNAAVTGRCESRGVGLPPPLRSVARGDVAA
jgi:hypothetical protein